MQLKTDEQFVISSLAAHFGATWSAGKNPPDAYLKIDKETIAVEISTLTQHIINKHGGTKSRLSEDSPALRLADNLKSELRALIPAGYSIVLYLRAPISKPRHTERKLKNKILCLVANMTHQTIEAELNILGNKIRIILCSSDGSNREKVYGVVSNQKSDPNISSNAQVILLERIATKAMKCSALERNGQMWLALFNDYFLASDETYKKAIQHIPTVHFFDKVLLISGNGSVATLHERLP